jgi:hypothetical protein
MRGVGYSVEELWVLSVLELRVSMGQVLSESLIVTIGPVVDETFVLVVQKRKGDLAQALAWVAVAG